jgi:5-methyltetrahydrofolate--homocysteine methyltransferase
MADFISLSTAVQEGKAQDAESITRSLVDEGIEAAAILEKSLLHGMSIVGMKFKHNEIYIPQVLIAARAMKASMSILEPLLLKANVGSRGKVLIGTVHGDLHDIGKNLVIIMLKGAGYEVEDMGVDQTPENFVERAKSSGIKLIGLSALLTTTIPQVRETIDCFVRSGIRDHVKIIIGGAPITEKIAQEVGADGYAPDASSAVAVFDKFNKA